jgi:hypothetical protein
MSPELNNWYFLASVPEDDLWLFWIGGQEVPSPIFPCHVLSYWVYKRLLFHPSEITMVVLQQLLVISTHSAPDDPCCSLFTTLLGMSSPKNCSNWRNAVTVSWEKRQRQSRHWSEQWTCCLTSILPMNPFEGKKRPSCIWWPLLNFLCVSI